MADVKELIRRLHATDANDELVGKLNDLLSEAGDALSDLLDRLEAAERDACIESADLIETLQAQHERDGDTIAKLTRDGSATYKRELTAIARLEAAERERDDLGDRLRALATEWQEAVLDRDAYRARAEAAERRAARLTENMRMVLVGGPDGVGYAAPKPVADALEAAEARLIAPVLTDEQREKLARAWIETISDRLDDAPEDFWGQLDSASKSAIRSDIDRFHSILTRIEGEKP